MRRLFSQFNLIAAGTAAALVLVLTGCRHADVNRELVERELRLQEDELYRLHAEIADCEKLLESTRRENEALKRGLNQPRSGAVVPSDAGPLLPPTSTDPPPDRAPRPPSGVPPTEVAPPDVQVPGIEGPLPSAPGRSSWKSTRGVHRASFEQPAGQPQDDLEHESIGTRRYEPKHEHVAKIVLNRRLTGGYNADRRLGDDGVIVVIEARNDEDRIVSRPGEVSVVVVDPAASTDDGRVARWDFSADEIQQRFRKTPRGAGIHLELLWPARLPESERLMVFARFTTADGEIHEASQPILVDLAADAEDLGLSGK